MGIFDKKKTQDTVSPGATPTPSGATATDAGSVSSTPPVVGSPVSNSPTTDAVSGSMPGVAKTSAPTTSTTPITRESVAQNAVVNTEPTAKAETTKTHSDEGDVLKPEDMVPPRPSKDNVTEGVREKVATQSVESTMSTDQPTTTSPANVGGSIQSNVEPIEPAAGSNLGQTPTSTTAQTPGVSGTDNTGTTGGTGSGTVSG